VVNTWPAAWGSRMTQADLSSPAPRQQTAAKAADGNGTLLAFSDRRAKHLLPSSPELSSPPLVGSRIMND
jgi:hypothetical protein